MADTKLELQNGSGQITVTLSGTSGNLLAGGNGVDGDVLLVPPDSPHRTDLAAIHLSAKNASIDVGSSSHRGTIHVRGTNGRERVRLDAAQEPGYDPTNPSAEVQGGTHGEVLLFDTSGRAQLTMSAYPAELSVHEFSGKRTVHIDGEEGKISLTGDIVLENADCAEDFDLASEALEADPGTVMVLDANGCLRPCEAAYDKKVAGVISGAGHLKPAIILNRKEPTPGRVPLALAGRVFCKVDARFAPIEVGSLLTTSPTPGHAMAANDPTRAFGTVVGKALRSVETGQGLIPILVALQ